MAAPALDQTGADQLGAQQTGHRTWAPLRCDADEIHPASHRQAAPWALLALRDRDTGPFIGSGRTYGSTSHERRARMPGDDIVPRPQFVITHAITIEAPAAASVALAGSDGLASRRLVPPLVGSTNSCFRQTEQARITLSKNFKIFRLAISSRTGHLKPSAASWSSS